MKFVKSKHRATQTNEHLGAGLFRSQTKMIFKWPKKLSDFGDSVRMSENIS